MSLGNALGYLTALPVPSKRQIPLIRSIHYFPLVGAAMGSFALLAFLWMGRFLPAPIDCVFVVLLAQFLAGWVPLRGLAEAFQGRGTPPGHAFAADFRLNSRGAGAIAASVILKSAALIALPADWRPRAVFVFPILGYCARTATFLAGRSSRRIRGARRPLSRRRVRAGFLAGALLFLLFLFPLKAALPALAIFAAVVIGGLRLRNRAGGGLTLQTVSVLSEAAEISVLWVCLIAARLPWG